MIRIRLQSQLSDADTDKRRGQPIPDSDCTIVIRDDAMVFKPNGDLLFIYLKKGLSPELHKTGLNILRQIKDTTNLRATAAGGADIPVRSVQLGYIDRVARVDYCRMTGWTSKHTKEFAEIVPVFQEIARLYQQHVPDRYAKQQAMADKTGKDWIIPGTPFSTISVQTNWRTCGHTDTRDLKDGFSAITAFTEGEFDGFLFTYPKFKIGVQLAGGGVLLNDSHEVHGNTGSKTDPDTFTRITAVAFYSENMWQCGTKEQEYQKMRKKYD